MTVITPLDTGASIQSMDGSADESVALQSALNDISGTRDILDLYGGNWCFVTPLALEGTVRVRNGQLTYGGTDSNIIALTAKPSAPAGGESHSILIMEDVHIHRKFNNDTHSQVGLQIENGQRVRLQRVDFSGWINEGTALRLEGVQLGYFEDCLFERSSTNLVITGRHLGRSSTALTFISCLFRTHNGQGASVQLRPFEQLVKGQLTHVSGARRIHFAFCNFENGRNGGFVDARASRRLTLENCTFEDPGPGVPSIKFSDQNDWSFLNSVRFCRFSNTVGDPAPAQIVIGNNVRETSLVGNSHAKSTPAVEDNGDHTTILQW